MSLTLRQICLVAADLQKTIDNLTHVFGIEVCYEDPGVGNFGLANSLLPIGTNFIEIVSPIQENTAAGRYLQRRGGDGGYMIITQADNKKTQQACRVRAEKMGIRIAWERPHETGSYMQLHPADTGGSFFEIDSDDSNDPVGNWAPAGGSTWKELVKTDGVTDILAAELQSDDPSSLAQRWSDIANIPLEKDSNGQIVMPLNNASLRFVEANDGRGEGLGGVDIKAVNPEKILKSAQDHNLMTSEHQVVIGGLRFNLV